jgi:hypothetical protein
MSYTIVHYNVISWSVYYGGLPSAMDAILAIIADGGPTIIAIDREAVTTTQQRW